VLDSHTGAFETGFFGGGTTKEDILLARSLGVTQVCVAVNKLDLCNWKEERYDFIVASITPYLKSIGFYKHFSNPTEYSKYFKNAIKTKSARSLGKSAALSWIQKAPGVK
jgi:translation elongation factor EF-1alpha